MDILNKIVAAKKIELVNRKAIIPLSELEAAIVDVPNKSLSNSLSLRKPGIIAEFKRRSPSKPQINLKADLSEIIKAYSDNSAAGISVLTNNEFFGGSRKDLESAAVLSAIPVLRKEFIIDTYQIVEAKALGANAILLIAEILSKDEVKTLSSFAHELNLEVLLELHSAEEIEKISDFVNIIGVNNRNLKTFKTDVKYSIDLYPKLPSAIPKISESGLSNIEDILRLRDLGFKGFLIGEHLMKQGDPGKALRKMIKKFENEN